MSAERNHDSERAAGAPDIGPSPDLPEGLTMDFLKEAVDLIWDWEENETDSDAVRLAIAIFKLYARGQGIK